MRDSHRMFLQGFMSHGILIARDVRKLYKTSCARFNGIFYQIFLPSLFSVLKEPS